MFEVFFLMTGRSRTVERLPQLRSTTTEAQSAVEASLHVWLFLCGISHRPCQSEVEDAQALNGSSLASIALPQMKVRYAGKD